MPEEKEVTMRELMDQNEVLRTQNQMLEDMPNLSKATGRQLMEELHARMFGARILDGKGK